MLRMNYSDHFLSVRPSVRPLTLSNDKSSKAIEAIYSKFGKKVAWLGALKVAEIMMICLLVWLPWQQKAPIEL